MVNLAELSLTAKYRYGMASNTVKTDNDKLYNKNLVYVQMHDRRVAVELDEFCRGTTLRANSELAEVWKLKDGVMAYMNYMHKIWPLEPGPQIIYKVLDDSRWATVAGDDKKLRANMIRPWKRTRGRRLSTPCASPTRRPRRNGSG